MLIIHGSKLKEVQFMAAKETKHNSIIKKQSKMALYKRKRHYMYFLDNKNTVLFFDVLCLLFNLQMCQIILLDPV